MCAPALAAAPATGAPEILVAGASSNTAAVQKIINRTYQQAIAKSSGAALGPDATRHLVDVINTALHDAGYTQVRAYLPSQLVTFSPQAAPAKPKTGTSSSKPVKPASQVAATAGQPTVVPPVSKRHAEQNQGKGPHIAVRGFAVQGVGDHPKKGITPESIREFADARLAKLGGSASNPAELDFDQLQGIADAVTKHYRDAGFIVATAFLPTQKVGTDGIVRIKVLEGRVGDVVVKGTKRYKPWVIAAPVDKLRGKVVQKDTLQSALLYGRDLPGVSISSTLQPGKKTGQTDVVMLAREHKPYAVTLGMNNYGTETTGRYRAFADLDWYAPLGIGDELSLGINYAFDPHQNTYGSIDYTIPTVKVPGLSFAVGADRSELELDNGSFASLDIHGPTSRYYAGIAWKFANYEDLSMTGSLKYIDERSQLNAQGFQLSDERFDVAQLGFSMKHTDRRFHGIGLLSAKVRKSLNDDSGEPDLVSPNHASDFTVGSLAYTRVQFLTPNQQLWFKFSGQYTNDALVPMEQFSIGGPDSARAFMIAESLMDKGYYSALEYHVNAPGFADKPSPFHGIPWRNLLTVKTFFDYAHGSPVGANRNFGGGSASYSDVGVGLIFRLRSWNHLMFRLDAAVPVNQPDSSDDHGVRVYGSLDVKL